MLSGGRFSAPTVNDRTYQVIIYLLLYQIAKILNSIEFLIKTRLCFLPLSASLHRDTERILHYRSSVDASSLNNPLSLSLFISLSKSDR